MARMCHCRSTPRTLVSHTSSRVAAGALGHSTTCTVGSTSRVPNTSRTLQFSSFDTRHSLRSKRWYCSKISRSRRVVAECSWARQLAVHRCSTPCKETLAPGCKNENCLGRRGEIRTRLRTISAMPPQRWHRQWPSDPSCCHLEECRRHRCHSDADKRRGRRRAYGAGSTTAFFAEVPPEFVHGGGVAAVRRPALAGPGDKSALPRIVL